MGRTVGGRNAAGPSRRRHRRHRRRSAPDSAAGWKRRVRPLPRGASCRPDRREGSNMSGRGFVLAIDTSGTRALVALGQADGTVAAERRWTAGYRHGEELLARTDEMLRAERVALQDLTAIVVGTGPGAFTGLRVGLATAKALARGLDVPIAGVPTSEALLAAARLAGAFDGTHAVLLLPAGPSDRVLVSDGEASLIKGGEEPE